MTIATLPKNGNWSIEWQNDAPVLRTKVKENRDWRFSVLLQSDRHWDNPGSDQALIKEHLEEAKRINAPVIDVGDWFCAMNGKYDPRASKSALRPEHTRGDYLDSLVNTSAEFLKPYASQFAMMSPGNHETSIHDRRETDLTERLVALLRAHGSPVLKHRYSGFLRYAFQNGKTSFSRVQWHTHGYGGGGPVSKDIIQTARQGAYLEGVDIVVSGHTHDQWAFPVSTRRLSERNKVLCSERLHLKIPSTKDKWGKDSWEDLKGHPPKPVGAWWLVFAHKGRTNDRPASVVFDAIRAL